MEEKELSNTVSAALRQIEEKNCQASLAAKGIPVGELFQEATLGRLTAFACGFLPLILGILWQEPGESERTGYAS